MSSCHWHEGLINHTPVNTPNFRAPQSTFITDIANPKYNLANVTWVLPGPFSSDHPGVPFGECGPGWVGSVINAVGKSKYWNSTVIFVFWDDWGGFYDHVPPYVVRDVAGPGFRVPLLVVSPYVKTGHVSHTNTEFATLLKFTETTFGLGSLGATDTSPYLNNLNDFFQSTPKPFTPISLTSWYARYGLCEIGEPNPTIRAPKSRWLHMVGDD